jgi:hypothetical protein
MKLINFFDVKFFYGLDSGYGAGDRGGTGAGAGTAIYQKLDPEP